MRFRPITTQQIIHLGLRQQAICIILIDCFSRYYPNGKLKTVVRNSIVQEKYDEQGRPIDERPGFEILYKDFQDYGCDANGNWIETKNFKDYVDFGTGLGRILKPYVERIFTYYEE